jgi:cyclic pyranopterin phosphate synthase
MPLFDNHGREITYLRLSVTDRCNLRCRYCMPENQRFLPKNDILSFEELIRISGMLTKHGIRKIRITGGEPFVRRDMMTLMGELAALPEKPELCITTNGVAALPYLENLKALGVKQINLSLDTLDPGGFLAITRRDQFRQTMEVFEKALALGFRLKINAVVMDGQNTDQLVPLASLAKTHPMEVRFIEEMPFNGEGARSDGLLWDHRRILSTLKQAFPDLVQEKSSVGETAVVYKSPGMKGSVGIIAAYSRTFCGTCNRIRITATGWLKTCLYDNGVVNLRDVIRSGATDTELEQTILNALGNRPRDGFEAEQRRRDIPVHESMSLIGG